jgi:hypothetical protein
VRVYVPAAILQDKYAYNSRRYLWQTSKKIGKNLLM